MKKSKSEWATKDGLGPSVALIAAEEWRTGMRKTTALLPMTLLLLALVAVAFFANQSTIHAEDDHGDYRFTSTNLKIGSGAMSGVIDPSDILFDVDYFSFQAVGRLRPDPGAGSQPRLLLVRLVRFLPPHRHLLPLTSAPHQHPVSRALRDSSPIWYLN